MNYIQSVHLVVKHTFYKHSNIRFYYKVAYQRSVLNIWHHLHGKCLCQNVAPLCTVHMHTAKSEVLTMEWV